MLVTVTGAIILADNSDFNPFTGLIEGYFSRGTDANKTGEGEGGATRITFEVIATCTTFEVIAI
ncbi:MAG: hypothetical protein EYR95_07590 [Phormidium sp. SL48-SHIP]|nr:MAG: hypothetical protein EYR95_07590 [Phormidium sp. SL48-SHIP]